jgi:hypothetical protein
MKVTQVFPGTSGKGESFWEVIAEGCDRKIIAFRPFKVGDEVTQEQLSLSKKGDCYYIKAPSRKDDPSLLIWNAILELTACEVVRIFDDQGKLDQARVVELALDMAGAIEAIQDALKPAEPGQHIGTVGQLFTRAYQKWGIYRAETMRLLGVQDTAEITDLAAAWDTLCRAAQEAQG